MVLETARAVLDGRIEAPAGTAAVRHQLVQVVPFLRADRLEVTQAECDALATRLRMLAEQVADTASGLEQPEHHVALAEVLGAVAQTLR